MKLYIISNGNSKIGLGHFFRCIGIASYFKKNNINPVFVIPDTSDISILKGFDILPLSINQWKSKKEGKKILSGKITMDDLVLIDLIEPEYLHFKYLNEIGCFICSFTIFLFKSENYYGQLSIFPSLDSFTKEIGITRIVADEKYFIIRKEVKIDKNHPKKKDDKAPTILVSMGGADPCNITNLVLEALDLLEFPYNGIVILGKANKLGSKIYSKFKRNKNLTFLDYVDRMSRIYEKTDLAIINGGNTRYELIYNTIPYFCISIHEQQNEINKKAIEKYGGINLGVYGSVKAQTIALELERYIKSPEISISIKNKMKKSEFGMGEMFVYNIIMDSYNKFRYEKAE